MKAVAAMKVQNFAHFPSKKTGHSPLDRHWGIFIDLAMIRGSESNAFILQSLTVGFELSRRFGHQSFGNFGARFGKPVWFVDCITIESPGSLTGWRDIRSRDPNCYQPAT